MLIAPKTAAVIATRAGVCFGKSQYNERMRRLVAQVLLVWALSLPCPVSGARIAVCECDHSHPGSLSARQCALCREAEKQPQETPVFFLKDINPTKPNRW